jgi:hypothetical protein
VPDLRFESLTLSAPPLGLTKRYTQLLLDLRGRSRRHVRGDAAFDGVEDVDGLPFRPLAESMVERSSREKPARSSWRRSCSSRCRQSSAHTAGS